MQQLLASPDMRAIFGVLSLVVMLGIVGWLTKTQLASSRQTIPSLAAPSAEPAAPAATVRDQSQQLQQQIKQSVEAAMQARPVPDDK
jgi:predicted lipid-binding transport protein (Tim44 family)